MTQIRREAPSLLAFLALAFSAAGIGGALTSRTVRTWYPTLRKPRLNPPSWIFGPVWTVLYALMAIAAWLTEREGRTELHEKSEAKAALAAWGVQLALNVGWSAAFFGLQSPKGAVPVIAALWAAIAACIALSARVSTLAAALLVPYLAWTSFASFLNVRIYQLNRSDPS